MTPLQLIRLILMFMIGSTISITAQVNPIDSMALVDFFENTDGPNWQDNSNWLNGPVNSWHGVILSGDEMNVIGISLPQNALQGKVPPSINDMQGLMTLDLFGNDIDSLPDLSPLFNLQFVNVDSNRLGFASVQQFFNCGNPGLLFCQQQPAGIPLDTLIELGDTLCLFPQVDGFGNSYQWFKDGALLPPTTNSSGAYKIDSVTITDGGSYSFIATNDMVEGMFIESVSFDIELIETDSIGAPIKARQLIVKFIDGIDQPSKDSIRNEFMATPIDSVQCLPIDLWMLPDSIFLPGGDTLFDIEDIKNRAGAKSKVEDVDYNHVVEDVDSYGSLAIESIAASSQMMASSPPGDTVIIAIIDTGMDTAHFDLTGSIWQNPTEGLDGIDNDMNCIIDDVAGYDFIGHSGDISDENSHGTHVAGIIKSRIDPGHYVALMGLKTHGANGRGGLFEMISAIYYARQKKARIINISSGYTGEASAILEDIIVEAGDSSQAVVVCSAGNNQVGVNNDTMPHYPSSFRVPNLLSVAALDTSLTEIATISNFGPMSVDLAAPGSQLLSAIPGNQLAEKTGTSMAAAWVSGEIANVILANPDLSAAQIVNCTKNTATFFADGANRLVTEGTINADSATVCSNQIVPGVRLRINLEGAFVNDTSFMSAALINQGLFPSQEPFSALGWFLTEGITDTIHLSSFQNAPVEWAVLNVTDEMDTTTIVARRPVIVRRDGQVVLPNGDSILVWSNQIENPYFVGLEFFRHLNVLSNRAYPIGRAHPSLDFIQDSLLSFHPNSFLVSQGGQRYLIGGDTNQDNVIDATDRSETWNNRNDSGYILFDVNLDGVCDAADRSMTWNNRNKSSNIPP